MEILKNAIVAPEEIEDLREIIGWDRSEGTYKEILRRHFAYYTVRNKNGYLVAYISVLSDGIADAFLLDLMIHPDYRNEGLGMKIVTKAITDVKDTGVKCVHVTFDKNLEPFYAKCGFHIFRGGIIDFRISD